MQRRSILLAVGASLAAPAIALAQSPAAPVPGTGNMPASGNMPAGGAMPMGEAEMTHMERTMRLGTASLLQSRVGVEKANIARVKMFAQFEVAEQETIGEVLRSMRHTGAGEAPKPSEAEMMAMLDANARQEMEKLRGASDAAFEREYIQAQITGHRALLDAQEDYIRVGRNREHLNVAKLARGHIREHLAHLDMLNNEVRRS